MIRILVRWPTTFVAPHSIPSCGCGCGTTIDAEKLGRDWIGIDVTQLAISLIKNRLQDTYGRRMKFVSGSAAVFSPSPPPREERAGERRHVSSNAIENRTLPGL